jgi:hypothetical protein
MFILTAVSAGATAHHDQRVSDTWSCHHFSLANPLNDGASDLPCLLRRVADTIEERGILPMDILDLTVSEEITGDGPWWSVTLYWSPDKESQTH